MAVESLKDIVEIGGFSVGPLGSNAFIQTYTQKGSNLITFQIQKGPVRQNGVNGCQVDTMIETAMIIIDRLNQHFHSEYNDDAIKCLLAALEALEARKIDRDKRGVEGLNLK